MGDSSNEQRKLSRNEAYVMAVGGMIGGGIFSVLGLVVEISGHLAPAAFLIAGILTFATGLSYAGLYERHKVAGGGVAYVKAATGSNVLAGHLGWALILGYIFTDSLYAFTFGQYLSNVFSAPDWVAPGAAIAITLAVLGVNLVGVGESGVAELVTVWGKLAILGGLAAFGLWRFDAGRITPLADKGLFTPLIAAAVIFIAYEGFQLLAYDVDAMEEPERNLRRAMLPAILTATAVYVVVALAAPMLVQEKQLVEQKEVALALAGKSALGTVGLWLITVAALFSTASAINATLFGTSRLAVLITKDGQLPGWLGRVSGNDVPRRALTVIAVAGGAFAMLGSIERIVTFASLTFLLVFSAVNFLHAREAETTGVKIVSGLASAGLAAAFATVVVWLALNRLSELLIAAGVALALALLRWWFVRRAEGSRGPSPQATRTA